MSKCHLPLIDAVCERSAAVGLDDKGRTGQVYYPFDPFSVPLSHYDRISVSLSRRHRRTTPPLRSLRPMQTPTPAAPRHECSSKQSGEAFLARPLGLAPPAAPSSPLGARHSARFDSAAPRRPARCRPRPPPRPALRSPSRQSPAGGLTRFLLRPGVFEPARAPAGGGPTAAPHLAAGRPPPGLPPPPLAGRCGGRGCKGT